MSQVSPVVKGPVQDACAYRESPEGDHGCPRPVASHHGLR